MAYSLDRGKSIKSHVRHSISHTTPTCSSASDDSDLDDNWNERSRDELEADAAAAADEFFMPCSDLLVEGLNKNIPRSSTSSSSASLLKRRTSRKIMIQMSKLWNLASSPSSEALDGAPTGGRDTEADTAGDTEVDTAEDVVNTVEDADDDTESPRKDEDQNDRLELVKTLKVTEEFYVETLAHLTELATQLEPYFDDEVSGKIFLVVVQALHRLHRDTILPALQSTEDTWDDASSSLAAVFKDVTFKEYIPYLTNLSNTRQTIKDMQAKHQEIKDIIHKMQDDSGFEKLQLDMLIKEPQQRLPHYRQFILLYERIPSVTDEERDQLQEIGERLQSLYAPLQKIQSYDVRTSESSSLSAVQERIQGLSIDDDEDRELLEESRCYYSMFAMKQSKAGRVFMFSDQLVLTCLKQNVKVHIPVADMLPLSEEAANDPERVLVIHRTTSCPLCIIFESKDIREHWQTLIYDIVHEHVVTRPDRGKKDGEMFLLPPAWYPDHQCRACMQCGIIFTTVKRKHHCRGCGRVVCAPCSIHQIPLAYMSYRKDRACKACYIKAGSILRPNAGTRKKERKHLSLPAHIHKGSDA